MTEAGVPGVELLTWFPAMVPSATARPIVDKINKWFNEVLATEETKKFLNSFGGDPFIATPEEGQALFRQGVKDWEGFVIGRQDRAAVIVVSGKRRCDVPSGAAAFLDRAFAHPTNNSKWEKCMTYIATPRGDRPGCCSPAALTLHGPIGSLRAGLSQPGHSLRLRLPGRQRRRCDRALLRREDAPGGQAHHHRRQQARALAATSRPSLMVRSKPDGHTIFIHAGNTVAGNMHLIKKPPFDAAKAIQVVATINKQAFMLAVDAKRPWKNVAELTAYLKEKGDKATYAVSANSGIVMGAIYAEKAGLSCGSGATTAWRSGCSQRHDQRQGRTTRCRTRFSR